MVRRGESVCALELPEGRRRAETGNPLVWDSQPSVCRSPSSVFAFDYAAVSCPQSSVFTSSDLSGIYYIGSISELEDLILKAVITRVLQKPLELAKDIVPIGLSQGDHNDTEMVFI